MILVDFGNRWNKEYLLQLRKHFKCKSDKILDVIKVTLFWRMSQTKNEQILKQV